MGAGRRPRCRYLRDNVGDNDNDDDNNNNKGGSWYPTINMQGKRTDRTAVSPSSLFVFVMKLARGTCDNNDDDNGDDDNNDDDDEVNNDKDEYEDEVDKEDEGGEDIDES